MCVHACKHFTKKVMLKSIHHEAMLTVGTFSYNTRTIMLADFTPTLNINTTLQFSRFSKCIFNELHSVPGKVSATYMVIQTHHLVICMSGNIKPHSGKFVKTSFSGKLICL